MAVERRWISCREAGEILSLSPKTVDDYCLRGLLPSIRIGHSRRIDRKALELGLEKQLADHGTKRGRR